MSNKFCHGQVGQLVENKLSYFIHLHKLHSDHWAEFVESTKYNSHTKFLQTNGHHPQTASSHKAKSYQPICFFLISYTVCLILILTVSDQVKTKTEMKMCKTKTKLKQKKTVKWKLKRKWKHPSKWKQNWNLNYMVKTKRKPKRK